MRPTRINQGIIMKKITFIIAMLAIAFASANAEDFGRGYGRGGRGSSSDHPLTIGVGFDMFRWHVSYDGTTGYSNVYPGFYFGGTYAAELSGNLFVEPGVNVFLDYILGLESIYENGYDENGYYYAIIATSSITMVDLSIPVNFGYRFDFGGTQLAFFAGPVIKFGIKASQKTTVSGVTTSANLYDDNMNRFNLMVDAGARLSFGRFSINLSYTLGLLNRVGAIMGDYGAIKENHLAAGVTYSF